MFMQQCPFTRQTAVKICYFLFLLGLREFLFEKEWYTSLVKAGHDEVKN